MGFFQGASNVRITGGQFNQFTNGNQVIYDQSSHYNNVNSFNTTNTATIDSHNDHSITSYDNKSPLRIGDRDDLRRSAKKDSQNRKDDIAQYFPPPTIHPALQPPAPPGYGPANVSHVDSFNVNNNRLLDSHNDYSQSYGIRKRPATPLAGSKRSKRRHQDRHAEQDQQSDMHSSFPGPKINDISRTSTGLGGSSTTRAQYADGDIRPMNATMQDTLNILMRQVEEVTSSSQPAPGTEAPYYHEYGNGYENQDEEGDEHERTGGDQHSSETSDSEDDEEQSTRMPSVPLPPPPPPSATLTHQLANLTLEDQHTKAGSSSSLSNHPPPLSENDESEDEESEEEEEDEEEEDEHQNYIDKSWSSNISPLNLNIPPLNIPSPNIPPLPANLGPSFSSSGPYHRSRSSRPTRPVYPSRPSRPPPSSPRYAPPQRSPQNITPNPNPNPNAILNAFNLPVSAVQGPAVFNTVHGDMVQIDQTVHTRNINSGNTSNHLVKDSYNHAPITVYGEQDAEAPASSSKSKKGRAPRKTR